jgi:hypothetical protein
MYTTITINESHLFAQQLQQTRATYVHNNYNKQKPLMYTTITNIAATKRDILYVQELFNDPLPLINF